MAGVTVLLIDDEPDMQGLVRMSLADDAIRVELADCLAAALDAARRRRPELILLDLALKSQDGLAILESLRADPATAGVPIVGFSVHRSREREAREAGIDDFVAKPFEVSRLREVVGRYVG